MHSVVRTPRGAEEAHKAGATTRLLVSLAEPCPLLRQSAYGALLESLRHHTVRQEVAAMRVDMTIPTVREHYVAAKPARKLEARILPSCIKLNNTHYVDQITGSEVQPDSLALTPCRCGGEYLSAVWSTFWDVPYKKRKSATHSMGKLRLGKWGNHERHWPCLRSLHCHRFRCLCH